MKSKEVHGMNDQELTLELKNLRGKLLDLRAQAVTEKVEDTSQFGKIRKDIARLMTEQTRRSTAKA
jgi:large subunit ribosomal protein L29